MKIIQVNTYDISGGAARSAYRLHRGLIEIGQKSRLLTTVKQSLDETVTLLSPESTTEKSDIAHLSFIQHRYIDANRTPLSNTPFSLPYPGLDLTRSRDILTADIINLHWIASFQSPVTLKKLLDLGKPVVWTLHDMWAFTGGCHYSSGCHQYQQDCFTCPQLRDDLEHLASALLKDKLDLLTSPNLIIVTPSRWLAESARNSLLFRHNRIEVIPYSLETDIFVPLPKAEAKQRLGIDPDTFTLLMGASDGNERRKGFFELLQALKICTEDIQFQELVQKNQFKLLCFGVPNEQLQSLPLPILSLGKITSDEKLSQIYSAADFFALPSLEDNLPNTMLEAMSCGTPIIAFRVGGIPDIVQDGITGRLSEIDPDQMAQAILAGISDRNLGQQMGKKCREVIETHHALPIQAHRYLDLYDNLLGDYATTTQKTNPATEAVSQSFSLPIDVSKGVHFDRIFSQISFKAAQRELANLRTRLDQITQIQGEFQQSQEELANLRTQLVQTESLAQQSQEELADLRTRLTQTQEKLARSQERISAMETSKFWQVRLVWFRVKQALGLAKDEIL